jgi:hypothetical protein
MWRRHAHTMENGQSETWRWGGEWSAGWRLTEAGPKGTFVTMQGIGEGVCQGLTTLQSLLPSHLHPAVLLDTGAQRGPEVVKPGYRYLTAARSVQARV